MRCHPMCRWTCCTAALTLAIAAKEANLRELVATRHQGVRKRQVVLVATQVVSQPGRGFRLSLLRSTPFSVCCNGSVESTVVAALNRCTVCTVLEDAMPVYEETND